MALLTPPPAAPQRGDRTTFANRVDAFITWLINFVSELVSLVANLNSIAAGGAYAIPYVIAPQASLPSVGGGKIATNSSASSFSTATTLYIDGADTRGASARTLLDGLFANGSAVKGGLRFVKQGDPSRWASFRVTGWVFNPSNGPFGIGTLTVECDGFSSANPFAVDDAVMLSFQRTGDKGDKGDNGTSVTPLLWLRDEKASGVVSGNPVQGVNTRVLNTVYRNTISGASLSNNRFTLPAGTYRFWGSAPANGVGAHQAYIQNITANNTTLNGTSEYSAGSYTTRSLLVGDVTVGSATVFELRHFSGTSSGSLGAPVGSGLAECYSEIIIEKIA